MSKRIIDRYIEVDEDVANECIEEFNYDSIDRKEFLDNCVFDRLTKCNSTYMNEIDEDIESLMKSSENMSLSQLSRTIKKFVRKCSNNMYKYELLLFNMLEDK